MGRKKSALFTVLALAPAIIIALGASIGGLYVSKLFLPLSLLRPNNDVIGNYLQTLGTVYAVLLVFVVFVVWSQFNEARGHVDREANELSDLIRTTRGFPASIQREVHDALLKYLNGILEREWPAMTRADQALHREIAALLDNVADCLYRFEPTSECHRTLYAEVLARFNDMCDARSDRLTSSRVRIPLSMSMLLYAGAIAIIASMYLFAVEDFTIHALITGALAGAISHVLYIVHDLDDIFGGDFKVSSAAIERLRAELLERRALLEA